MAPPSGFVQIQVAPPPGFVQNQVAPPPILPTPTPSLIFEPSLIVFSAPSPVNSHNLETISAYLGHVGAAKRVNPNHLGSP